MTPNVTVLNVDDQEISRYILSRMLRRQGFHVREAATGVEALRLARSERPGLVLLDVNLPDINGLEVCRRMKADPATSAIPVLHVSATFQDTSSRIRGLENGADAYLTANDPPELIGATIRAIVRTRQARRALRKSERQFRALMDAVPLLAWRTGALGIVTDVNRVWTDYTGLTITETRQDGYRATVHPEDQAATLAAAAGGRAWECEHRLRRHDGAWRWHRTRAVPLRSSSGAILHWFFTSTDIQAQKEAEQGLSLAARISDALYFYDREWRFTALNDAAQSLAGAPNHPEFQRAMAERTPVHFARQDPASGRWFDISAYPSESGLTCFARDMTAARQEEKQDRFFLQAAGVGGWEWDMRTNAVHWSENMEAVHGQPPGSFGGSFEGFLAGVHPEDRPMVLEATRRAVDAGGDYRVEYRQLQDGRAVSWMEGKGRVLYGPDGKPERMIGICMDVTARKELEERLRAAAKMESLGVLAGGIAHDFNNLLVGVVGNASLALGDLPESSPVRPLIEDVLRSGERAAELTRQILAYSGQGRYVVEHLDLSEQVNAVAGLLRTSVPWPIELRLELARELPRVEADASQIHQVLSNLVLNAAEAVGDRPGRITVVTSAHAVVPGTPEWSPVTGDVAPGLYAVLEVRDTGSGIDVPALERIFDPFFTTKFPGRGLGLAAVAGIVRSHAGAIFVASAPGRGTTFRIMLPGVAERQQAPDLSAACS